MKDSVKEKHNKGATSVADLEHSRAYYWSANAETYRIEYVDALMTFYLLHSIVKTINTLVDKKVTLFLCII